MLRIGNNSWKL
jgi:hypothetical protein